MDGYVLFLNNYQLILLGMEIVDSDEVLFNFGLKM